ncbi:hypothetical protein UPYG_G00145880 [Umbra pygmaea]|uniref:Uncharacterized protein n=1 Tax=Umbra pygmaea TaxID=75934 RepID=A0ABD0X0T4_UMBPY
MSKIELLRLFLNERLTAAAEEIFGTIEKTIVEYQEEVSRTKEENNRLRRLLRLQKTDPQTLINCDEVPPPELEVSAAEEIFGAVEKTIAEYHEEVSRTKEENDRLQKLIDIVTQPDIKLHRSGLTVVEAQDLSEQQR